MTSEIACIAEQLLTQVSSFHKNRIVLKFLAPQFITVAEKNFFKNMPKVEIMNVETMLIADALMGDDKAKELSGVNLLFLDPAYYKVSDKDDFDWSVDVWSVGVILYLLITGGVDGSDDEEHYEPFDFREGIWYDLDESIMNFVKQMVQERPDNRASIDTLLKHDFIEKYRGGQLWNKLLAETYMGPLDAIMYKFYVAYLINELMSNQMRFFVKKEEI